MGQANWKVPQNNKESFQLCIGMVLVSLYRMSEKDSISYEDTMNALEKKECIQDLCRTLYDQCLEDRDLIQWVNDTRKVSNDLYDKVLITYVES